MSSICERGGVLGTVKGNGETETFFPKANFSLTVIAKVEGSKDGYIARITRAPDNVTRDCFFSASNAMHKNEFIHAINGAFGSGGMFCTLTDIELGNYLLKKVMNFMGQDRPHTLRAVRHIGQQEGSPPIFVLSPELHMNEDGDVIECDRHRIYFDKQHIEPHLLPVIPIPFSPSLEALQDLWHALKCCAQHNKNSALFTLGAVAMNMHFQTLVELKGGAPVVVLYGEPDVGKTTIANAAMSVAGIEACSFRGMRREFFVHLASLTSMGLLYDDPNKIQEVENIIIDFYNGMTRGSFKRGLETPQCGFMLSCNFSLGKIQRLLSRVVIIPRARSDEHRVAFSSLKDYKEKASAAVGYFIALGKKYRTTGVFKVDELEEQIGVLLPNCGGRTIKGYANLVWFTHEVAHLVGESATVVWDAIKNLAPQLDKLQHKEETIAAEEVVDPHMLREKFWTKIGMNLIDLAKTLGSQHQARSFLQVGKQSGQDSISVAVDVATNLMQIKGITAKFTLDELRDNISTDKCGCRGQSRRFNILENNQWNGKTKYLKVPVIHLSVFTPDIRTALIKCVYPNYEPTPVQDQELPRESLTNPIQEQDLTQEPSTNSMQDQDLTQEPSTNPIQDQDLTQEPSTNPIQDQDLTQEPSANPMQDQDLTQEPSTNPIQDQDLTQEPSTNPIQDQDLTQEPSTNPIQDQDLTQEPSTNPIQDQDLTQEPSTNPIQDQDLTQEPSTNPMQDRPVIETVPKPSSKAARRLARKRKADTALFDSLHGGILALNRCTRHRNN